jgi:hypothetical protein
MTCLQRSKALATPMAARKAARLALAFLMVSGVGFAPTTPAYALSEIKREELPATAAPPTPSTDDPIVTVPLPEPVQPSNEADPDKTGPTVPADPAAPAAPAAPDGAATPGNQDDANAPLPQIEYDTSKLPIEVQRLRDSILEACRSGDAEKLRPLLGQGDEETQLSLGDIESDPITFLKGLSGDEEGLEILAIMEEVLSAGYVHLDVGTAEELYVWPYFFAIPIDKLTAPQKVEMFKIVTAGDYEDMKNFGSYVFYRFGITPKGKWAFFVAGE